jgi:lincosamide and streptogramin A transport system ATP-binding/permease protein
MGVKPDKGHIGSMAAKMMKRSKSAEIRLTRAAEQKEKLLKNIERLDELSITSIPYMKKRLINAVDLTLKYDNKAVFSNLSFSLEEGDRMAIVGQNGSGKSSLLHKIMGENIESEGVIDIGSNLKISYVPQDTSFLKGDLKAYALRYEIDEGIFKSILRKMDFPRVQFEKDMRDFSQGQKKKVLLARSLCEKANLYIWDEPLNYIDVFTRMQIEMLLDKFSPTMMLVEHDKEFVDNVTNKLLVLR